MSRRIFILCDGGLGNRLGGLVGGLVLAEQLHLTPIISWPINNWCGCSFGDLFDSESWQVNARNVFEVFEQNLNNTFVIHENQTDYKLQKCHAHSVDNARLLSTQSDDVVYYHNKVPAHVSAQAIVRQLGRIRINQDVQQAVVDFCCEHAIDHTVIGLHLRKTENFALDEQALFDQVLTNANQRYFVCSDDQSTQERFAQLPNVRARPKTSYVGKMVAGSWYESVVDTDGRKTKYNILRDRQSVIEALIDMLILSRTHIQPTVKSSFLNFARYFAQVADQLNKSYHGHNESASP
jgi:hypothetical protein